MKRAVSPGASSSKVCYFTYGDEPARGPTGYQGLGRVCQGCGDWVRESRIAAHGLPKTSKKPRLSEREEIDILKNAARAGVYIYATTFHTSSKILDNLSDFYGSSKHVRAATSTESSRIKMAGDLYEMRLDGKIGIRMSRTQSCMCSRQPVGQHRGHWMHDSPRFQSRPLVAVLGREHHASILT